MKSWRIALSITMTGIFFCGMAATNAQESTTDKKSDKIDVGKVAFEANCAVCHGMQGHGDGPYADMLNTPVPNLSTLAKRNGGAFPFQKIYQTIDGTRILKAHGTSEMPIWGKVFNSKGMQYCLGWSPCDPEPFVRAQILALTEYVYRLQE